jgi:hypothetical protein
MVISTGGSIQVHLADGYTGGDLLARRPGPPGWEGGWGDLAFRTYVSGASSPSGATSTSPPTSTGPAQQGGTAAPLLVLGLLGGSGATVLATARMPGRRRV